MTFLLRIGKPVRKAVKLNKSESSSRGFIDSISVENNRQSTLEFSGIICGKIQQTLQVPQLGRQSDTLHVQPTA